MACLAADRQAAAHQLDQITTDRQAQPRAPVACGDAVGGLIERGEEAVHLTGRHARSGIGHVDQQDMQPGFIAPGAQLDGDDARIGEFDGVGDQVVQHLAQAHGVALNHARHIARAVQTQAQALSPDRALPQAEGVVEQVAQVEIPRLDLQAPGVEAGVVQQVVQQPLHHQPGVLDHGRLLTGRGRGGGDARQFMGAGQDGADRGAQVVGDGGQKSAAAGHDALGLTALAVGFLQGAGFGFAGGVKAATGRQAEEDEGHDADGDRQDEAALDP